MVRPSVGAFTVAVVHFGQIVEIVTEKKKEEIVVRLIRWTSTLDKSNAHRCWRKSKLVVPVPTHEVHGRQIQRLRIKQVVLGVLKFQSSGFQSLHFVLQCYGVGVEGLRFLFGFLGGAGCLLAV